MSAEPAIKKTREPGRRAKSSQLEPLLSGFKQPIMDFFDSFRRLALASVACEVLHPCELNSRTPALVKEPRALRRRCIHGLRFQQGVSTMCDYSLLNVRSRPAKVGDKLTTRDFGTGTRGFAAAEDNAMAVCVLPGTELAFSRAASVTESHFLFGEKAETLAYATAIFRQVNKNEQFKHHDALEFPNGRIVLLTQLCSGQEATVLQLPAQPMSETEAYAQKRVAFAG
jgi:hypothetical protein